MEHEINGSNGRTVETRALLLDESLTPRRASRRREEHGVFFLIVAVDGYYATSEILNRFVNEKSAHM
jgi:hypothetical protein